MQTHGQLHGGTIPKLENGVASGPRGAHGAPLVSGDPGGSNGDPGAKAERREESREVKAVIVGDGACGKTSLLMVYAKGAFPEKYTPSVFEKFSTTVALNKNTVVPLSLWDTSGQEDYDRLRPLAYHDTHVILICFDVTSPDSLDNVFSKWAPEVGHFCRGTPVLLVGCKSDLRKDKLRLRRLREQGQEPVTYTAATEAAQRIQAHEYLECSAKFFENVSSVFRDAVQLGLRTQRKERRRAGRKARACTLL
ncbi:rho-related GTP-binding protein RhoF-like [Lethenteron reissneri]|uniref:rho-related GTP-binding protein RhoF-like n=1 Tax=Lethenteron reissneri TaxID=7753 RepID=UPI002AB7AD39|nr:rho-related GTP-binding protein RhoF-like [Lethenteron reissneri]